MAERKRGGRTETLSLRLDPKTRFMLEFLSRLRGQSITTVVERAIKESADGEKLYEDHNSIYNWTKFWHPHEGIRELRTLADHNVYRDFEEDRLLDFVKKHWQFFANSADLSVLADEFVFVLWNDIGGLIEHWRKTRATDRWATGKLMLEKLKSAGFRGPTWPPQAKPTAPKKEGVAHELDDDVPF